MFLKFEILQQTYICFQHINILGIPKTFQSHTGNKTLSRSA